MHTELYNYFINIVLPPHVTITLVAIVWEVY